MTARELIEKRRLAIRRWSWAPVSCFLLGIPIYGFFDDVVASIIFWPGFLAASFVVWKHSKRLVCPHCGENTIAYFINAGHNGPLLESMMFLPCCRGELDAELDREGAAHDDA